MCSHSDTVRVIRPLTEPTLHAGQLKIAFRTFVGKCGRKLLSCGLAFG